MRWLPWQRRETRASYTDALVTALLQTAAGGVGADPNSTGALETAAGLYQRALQGADVEGGPDSIRAALSPEVMGTIGRELIRRGEAAFLIRVDMAGLRLLPAATVTVLGGPSPERWRYDVTLSGPDGQRTERGVPAAGVLHFRFAVDAARPWRGLGPIQAASLAGRLNAGADAQLGNETLGPHGNLIPIPSGGDDDTVTELRQDIAKLAGKAAVVEQAQSWDVGQTGRGGAPADWRARRLGADPPAALVELRRDAEASVLAACGVPVELVAASGAAAGEREAWRRFLHGTVQPLSRLLLAELHAKLDPSLSLSFAELRASDLAGRARAYKQLTEAGMDAGEAKRHAGFES